LSADPVLDASSPQSLNGYDYASNNPIGLSDPSGLHTDDPSSNRCDSACGHGVIAGDASTYGNDAGTSGGDCNSPAGPRACGSANAYYSDPDPVQATPRKSHGCGFMGHSCLGKAMSAVGHAASSVVQSQAWSLVATGLELAGPICPVCGAVGVAMNVVSAIVTCVQGEAIACATDIVIAATGGAGMVMGRAAKLAEAADSASGAARGSDFIASSDGTVVSTSRGRLEGGFKTQTFQPLHLVGGHGIYPPDGSLVRIMEPTGQAPLRASFTNGNGGPISPFTGKPVQPPPGLSPSDRLAYVRARTHVELGP
jgi:hypothetical protein